MGEPANASRPVELEREDRGALERGQIEAVGELARRRLEVAARELRLAELHLDLGHREERGAAPLVVGEQPREKLAGDVKGRRVSPGDRRGDADVDGLFGLGEHVEGRLVVALAEIAEVGQLVGRGRHERGVLRAPDGLDDVVCR